MDVTAPPRPLVDVRLRLSPPLDWLGYQLTNQPTYDPIYHLILLAAGVSVMSCHDGGVK